MRYVTLAISTLGSLPLLVDATTNASTVIRGLQDGNTAHGQHDWHIVCTRSACFYEERGKPGQRRSLETLPNLNDKGHFFDEFDATYTRCKPTDHAMIESLSDGKWQDMFNCRVPDSCFDLFGHGSCNVGKNVWAVPGLDHLSYFKCDNPQGKQTCNPIGSQPMEELVYMQHFTKRDGRGFPDTRCRAGADRVIEWFDGTAWKDFYICSEGHQCVNVDQRGGCSSGTAALVPILAGNHQTICDTSHTGDYEARIQCDPQDIRWVQYYNDLLGSWVNFHQCGDAAQCEVIDGHVGCKRPELIVYPTALVPCTASATSGASTAPTTSTSVATPSDINFITTQTITAPGTTVILTVTAVPTSIDLLSTSALISSVGIPDTQSIIPGTCPGGFKGPPTGAGTPESLTRCDPLDADKKQVQFFYYGQWVNFYTCHQHCETHTKFAACFEQAHKYLVPTPPCSGINLRRDLAPSSSQGVLLPPDFHTIDTRCNPANLSEVQRFQSDEWVHHFSCTFEGSCVDVDGHGACRIKDNTYELPSANHTSVALGEAEDPLRAGTRCNPQNETEVQEWNGKQWGYHGVCLPPYLCHDFNSQAEYAICVNPSVSKSDVWLPWPSLSTTSKTGLVTRCQQEDNLERFDGQEWVSYRNCSHSFRCQKLPENPHNGGCVAPSISAVKSALSNRRRSVRFVTPGGGSQGMHYQMAQQVPRREDDSLVEDGETLIHQGEELVRQGQGLLQEGHQLHNQIYGAPNVENTHDSAKQSASKASSNFEADTTTNPGSMSQGVWGPNVARRDTAPTNSSNLLDESVHMQTEGSHLINEGSQLAAQGKKLLQAIFGDQADDVISDMLASANAHNQSAFSMMSDAKHGGQPDDSDDDSDDEMFEHF